MKQSLEPISTSNLCSFICSCGNKHKKTPDKQVLFIQVWHCLFKKVRQARVRKKSESCLTDITVAAMFYCLNPASAYATLHTSARCSYDMMTARGNAVPSSSGEQQRQFLWLPQNSSRIVRECNAAASLHSWWPFPGKSQIPPWKRKDREDATCIVNVCRRKEHVWSDV